MAENKAPLDPTTMTPEQIGALVGRKHGEGNTRVPRLANPMNAEPQDLEEFEKEVLAILAEQADEKHPDDD